jgi:hypothetical protein
MKKLNKLQTSRLKLVSEFYCSDLFMGDSKVWVEKIYELPDGSSFLESEIKDELREFEAELIRVKSETKGD